MLLGSSDSEMSVEKAGLEARTQAIQGFFQYFGALAAERRKNPTDDLATVIANAHIDGQPIDNLAAMSYYLIIATAGHDTTSGTVACADAKPHRTVEIAGQPRLAARCC